MVATGCRRSEDPELTDGLVGKGRRHQHCLTPSRAAPLPPRLPRAPPPGRRGTGPRRAHAAAGSRDRRVTLGLHAWRPPGMPSPPHTVRASPRNADDSRSSPRLPGGGARGVWWQRPLGWGQTMLVTAPLADETVVSSGSSDATAACWQPSRCLTSRAALSMAVGDFLPGGRRRGGHCSRP